MSDQTKIAFENESTKGELNPRPQQKEKEGSLSKVINNTTKLITVVVIIFLVLILWYLNRGTISMGSTAISTSQSVTSAPVKPSNEQPREGTIEIDSTTWRGMFCGSSDCLDSKILTDDVWWEVRMDKDDNRIIPLYPKNWDKKKFVVVPEAQGANYLEWRIKPGQQISHGIIAFALHKKSEAHRFY